MKDVSENLEMSLARRPLQASYEENIVQKTFVLNADKTPLMPCSNKRARIMLERGDAAVYRRIPFTIIIKEQLENPTLQEVELKIDPG